MSYDEQYDFLEDALKLSDERKDTSFLLFIHQLKSVLPEEYHVKRNNKADKFSDEVIEQKQVKLKRAMHLNRALNIRETDKLKKDYYNLISECLTL